MENGTTMLKPKGLGEWLEKQVKEHGLTDEPKHIGSAKVVQIGLGYRVGREYKSQWLDDTVTKDAVITAIIKAGGSRVEAIYKVVDEKGNEYTLLPNITKKKFGDSPALALNEPVQLHAWTYHGKPNFGYRQ